MKVLMVGSARESGGGVASVIRLMEQMPVWKKYGCHWLGTQIQRNYLWKIYYALKAYLWAVPPHPAAGINLLRGKEIRALSVPCRPGSRQDS